MDNLPPHPTPAILLFPSRSLAVEDCLGEGKPLWLISGGVGELHFRGAECGEGPETLIVISEFAGDVEGFVVFVLADLVKHSLHNDRDVAGVVRVCPVVDEGLEEGGGGC